MKKTIALISVVFVLSGCSLLNAYKTSKYDDGEYFTVNQVRTVAQMAKPYCDEQYLDYSWVERIYVSSLVATNYTQYIPKNETSHILLKGLHEIVLGFKSHYEENAGQISRNYCRLKLEQIHRSAEKIQQVIGSKNR